MRRKTIEHEVQAVGVGVRGGHQVAISLRPAESGSGLQILRTDDQVRATRIGVDTVVSSAYCTAVGSAASRVDFIEHLMAALHAAAVTDILIEVADGEMPMFDGSALPYWELIQEAGVAELDDEVEPIVIREPIYIADGQKTLTVLPSETPSFAYFLAHPHPLVGEQSAVYAPANGEFASELAPARTWGTYEDLLALQEAGLLAGGTEDNALVVYPNHLSAAPRWTNAFARHKLLDLYGDLYLLGAPVVGSVSVARTGHADNLRLAREIAAQAQKPS